MKKVKVIFPDGSTAEIDESELASALAAGAKRHTEKSTAMVFKDGSIADIADDEIDGAIAAGAVKKKVTKEEPVSGQIGGSVGGIVGNSKAPLKSTEIAPTVEVDETINAEAISTIGSFKRRGKVPESVVQSGGNAIVSTPEVLFSTSDKEQLNSLSQKHKLTQFGFNPINEIRQSAGVPDELLIPEKTTPLPFVAEMSDVLQLENDLLKQAREKRGQLSKDYFKSDAKTITKTKNELDAIETDLKAAQVLKKKISGELAIEGEDVIEATIRTDNSGNDLNKTTNRLKAISPNPVISALGVLGISQETQDKIDKLPPQFVTGLNYLKNAEPVVFERITDALKRGLPISESQVANITQQGIELEQARWVRKLQKEEITPVEFQEKILQLNTVRKHNLLDNEEVIRAFLADGAANILDEIGKTGQKGGDASNPNVAALNYFTGHTWNYSDEQIKYATEKYAKNNGLDPQDGRVQKAIKYLQDNEGAMIMENSIAKAGGVRELFKGLSEPIKGISNSIEDLAKSSNDVYVEAQSQGNVNVADKRLKAEDAGVRGVVNDVVKGAGQFITQAGLAYLTSGAVGLAGKGLGGVISSSEAAAGAEAVNAGTKIGNTLINTKDGIATFITSYGQAYDSNLKNALNYTSDNALAKRAASINSAMEGATELFLSPLDIARGIANKFKTKGVTEGLLKVLSDKNLMNNPDKLKNYLSNVVKGVVGTSKVAGAEIGEEFVTQISDYVTNSYLNPNSEAFQNRDLQGELATTAYETGLSMAIPALLNGVGAANANTFSKGSLLVAAQNRQKLIESLDEDLALDNIDQNEYNQKTAIVNTAAIANENLPLKADGSKLNTDEKADYIFSRTSEATMKNKIEVSKDEAEKRILEGKIKEQQDFRTKLLGNEPTAEEKPVYKIDGVEVDKATFLNTARSDEGNDVALEVTGDEKTQGFLRSIGGVDEKTAETKIDNTAVDLLNTARETGKLGVFKDMEDEGALKMIAQQAQNLDDKGKPYEGADAPEMGQKALNGTKNQFGEELVNKAIELYPYIPVGSEVDALKDVESTAKALDADKIKQIEDIADIDADPSTLKEGTTPAQFVANLYHLSKADGTNPKLVKAVEEALANKLTEAKEKDTNVSTEQKPPANRKERLAAFKKNFVEPVQTEEEVQKQWNELSMNEKLALAKDNLPEVDNLSNVEAVKVADENAKMLLGKLNKKEETVTETKIEEPVTTPTDVVVDKKEQVPEPPNGEANYGNVFQPAKSSTKTLNEKQQELVNELPKQKVSYKDLKGIGDLSVYLNNPEALNAPHLKSAKAIYEDIKNGKDVRDTPSVNEKMEVMDGQNRIAAQLAAGIENIDVAVIDKSFYENQNKKSNKQEVGDNQTKFAIQEPTSQAISDMKDIVKDYVDENKNSLKEIQDDVAQELGDNSQEMRDLVEKAYNEFYKTKESTPVEVTSGVIGKVGKFLSRLFGGTAASKVFILKDTASLQAKAEQLSGDIKYQKSLKDYINIVFTSIALSATPIQTGTTKAPIATEINEGDVKARNTIKKLLTDYYAVNDEVVPQEVIDRALKVWERVGKPEILPDSTKNNDRAFAQDGKIGNITDFDDLVAELSHSAQYVSKAKLDERGYTTQEELDKIEYDRKGSVEYDAHKLIEPTIAAYILNGKKIQDAIKTEEVSKAVDKYKLNEVLYMKNPKGEILGFSTPDGKIYLNAEKINVNSPVHESAHIFTEWIKQNNTEVYTRGMQLTENSKYLKEVRNNEFYKTEASKLGSEGSKAYSDYMKHEALAMAIGDKGAQFVGETRKKDFKEWLNNLWNTIKAAAGFKDITANELQNLTFDEFTKRAAADILRDEEVSQQQTQTQGTGQQTAAPKSKVKSKLTEAENKVIRDVLDQKIDEKSYPTFFDMNQQGQQQTAITQEAGQERTALDGSYVKAHLEDLRGISLMNARILQESLGTDWKEKMIDFLEENPTAGNVAQVSGILNVMNTDIYNEISKSKNGTEISKLKDLQARADRITYDTARSASLALNQRRMYQDFGQGKDVADILSSVILTPEQQDMKAKAEEVLKQKFDDAELNKPKPAKVAKPKSAPKPKAEKPDDSVKKDLISKGKKAAQQTDVDGKVTTVSLKDKINQANDALNGFKC